MTPRPVVAALTALLLAACSKDHDGNRLNPLALTSPSFYTGITMRDEVGNALSAEDPNDWHGTGSLSSVFVYPNPWRADRHAAIAITIDHLPAGATITIYQYPLLLVRTISSAAGFATWDLTDNEGHPVGSGIYHAVVTSGSSETSGDIEIRR